MLTRYKPEDNSNCYWLLNSWVDVQTEWHYWLSQSTKCRPSMNIEEHHPLSHARWRICHPSRACWWACYRTSWMCSCFHCCWICMTFIYLLRWISFIWFDIHTFQTCSIINEQVTQLGRHFIIYHLVHQSYIVIGEEIDSTILCQYTDDVRR